MKIKENVGIGDLGIILNQVKQNKDDISEMKNKLTTNQVSITSNYGHIKVYRYGNVVSVDIDGNVQETSGIIASGLPKPMAPVWLQTLTNGELINVDTAGQMRIFYHIAGNWVNFHGTYISNN